MLIKASTVWKVSKYSVFSGPYFPIFGLNTEVYGVYTYMCLPILLGNHRMKEISYILYNISVFAFFSCILSTKFLTRYRTLQFYISTYFVIFAMQLLKSRLYKFTFLKYYFKVNRNNAFNNS